MFYYDLLLVDEDGEETRLSPFLSDRVLTAGNQIRVGGRCWEIVRLEIEVMTLAVSVDDPRPILTAEPCVVEHDPELDA